MMANVRPDRFTCAAGLAALMFLGACSSGSGTDQRARRASPEASASETESSTAKGQGEKKGSGDSKNSVELSDDPAPEFEIETFSGGTFAIREELGTPVVLNFWESW